MKLLISIGSAALISSAAWLWSGDGACSSSASACGSDKATLVSADKAACAAEKTSLVSTEGACSVAKASLVSTDKSGCTADKASLVSADQSTCTAEKASLVSAQKSACSAEKASLVSTSGDCTADKASCTAEKASLVATETKGDCSDKSACTADKASLVSADAPKASACCPSGAVEMVSTRAGGCPLEAIKPLAGKWVSTQKGDDGKPLHATEFRVSSNGSTLVETMFPGTPHEMTNVYALDGQRLVLTHYCAAGNQPRMQLVGSENGVMKFEMFDATNLPDKNQMHMAELELTIVGPDKIVEKWSSHMNGKKVDQDVKLELVRAN